MRGHLSRILLALALFAAACGSGGDGEGAGASTTSRPGALPGTSEGPSSSAAASSSTAPGSSIASSTSVPAPTAAPSTSATSTPAVASGGLATDAPCDGITAPSESTLTFVAEDRLWSWEGDVPRCLVELDAPSRDLVWSPDGQRVLLADGEVWGPAGRLRDAGGVQGRQLGWTWPTGRRFLYGDGPSLVKHEADGSGATDASAVDRHEVLAYHPDGLHFAVAGVAPVEFEELGDDDELVTTTVEVNGLFIVDNDGGAPQQLVDPLDATITEVAFAGDGTRLTMVVDHDDAYHVHSFVLPEMVHEFDGEKLLTALPEDTSVVEPDFESVAPIHHLVVDPADPTRVAFSQGECGAGAAVELLALDEGGYSIPVAPGIEAVPVGFVGEGRLAMLEVGAGCVPTGDLWMAELDGGTVVRVADGVSAAAVRFVAPELRFSLQDIDIAGFA